MDQAQNLRNIVKKNTVVKENEKKSRIITVTSGKGGVGKTSVSINLAIQFRLQGKSVIIFDADFGLANIEVMIGAIPKYNLSDLISLLLDNSHLLKTAYLYKYMLKKTYHFQMFPNSALLFASILLCLHYIWIHILNSEV